MEKEKNEVVEKTKPEVIKLHNNIEIIARCLQAICLGLFALGVASGLGDYGKVISLPFSQFSITTFVFGLIGTVITEVIARQAKRW